MNFLPSGMKVWIAPSDNKLQSAKELPVNRGNIDRIVEEEGIKH